MGQKKTNHAQEYLLVMALTAVALGLFFPQEWVDAANALAKLF